MKLTKNRVALAGNPACVVTGFSGVTALTGISVGGIVASRCVVGARNSTVTSAGVNVETSITRSNVTVKPLIWRVPSSVKVLL